MHPHNLWIRQSVLKQSLVFIQLCVEIDDLVWFDYSVDYQSIKQQIFMKNCTQTGQWIFFRQNMQTNISENSENTST